MPAKQSTAPNPIFERIAKDHLLIEILVSRNMDRPDFTEVSVRGLHAALQAAFDAGTEAARARP